MNEADKELLTYAAKAAEIDYGWQHIFDDYEGSTSEKFDWNPLTDDVDAMRLAVKLGLNIIGHDIATITVRKGNEVFCQIQRTDDSYAATRLAIVCAAAEIGKSMQEK